MKGGRASGKGKEGGKGGRRIPIIKRSDGVRNEGVRVSFFFFSSFPFSRERDARTQAWQRLELCCVSSSGLVHLLHG